MAESRGQTELQVFGSLGQAGEGLLSRNRFGRFACVRRELTDHECR